MTDIPAWLRKQIPAGQHTNGHGAHLGLPRDVLVKHSILPEQQRNGTIDFAVASPADDIVAHELAHSVGRQAEVPRAEPAVIGPRMRIFVVAPTYNEAENLEGLVAGVRGLEMDATIVVVDDSSPDGTGRMADSLAAANSDIKVIHRRGKQGLGSAYIAGIDYALALGGDIVVQMDADGSHDPAAIPGLIHPVSAGMADITIGSRYIDGGGVVGWPLRRRLLSWGGNGYARILLGRNIHDYTSGFVALGRPALQRIPYRQLTCTGFAYLTELKFACKRARLRIREIPITFRERRRGDSKLSLSIVWEALAVIPQARVRVARLVSEGELLCGGHDAAAGQEPSNATYDG